MHSFNGKTFIRPIFPTFADDANMCSDASKQGYGATFGTSWIQGNWPEDWRELDITVLELYPVYMLVTVHAHKLKNSHIIFRCDNQAVVEILNKQSSKHKFVMKIIRTLVLVLLQNNIILRAVHIPGKTNILCDSLSRQVANPAMLSQFGMQPYPTPVPSKLLPQNFKRD